MRRQLVVVLTIAMFGCLPAHGGGSTVIKESAEWVMKKAAGKTATAGLKEGTEQAIRQACKRLGNEAVELAARHGDDAAKLLARHGDAAVPLIRKWGVEGMKVLQSYGDDVLRLASRHGDNIIPVLVKNVAALAPLTAKYGDDVVVAFVEHPGLGKELVEAFGRKAGSVAGRVTDDGAVVLAKCMAKASEQEARVITREVLAQSGKQTGKEIGDLILRRTPHLALAAGIVMVAYEARGGVHDVREWAQTAPAGVVSRTANRALLPLVLVVCSGFVLVMTTPRVFRVFLEHRRLSKAATKANGSK